MSPDWTTANPDRSRQPRLHTIERPVRSGAVGLCIDGARFPVRAWSQIFGGHPRCPLSAEPCAYRPQTWLRRVSAAARFKPRAIRGYLLEEALAFLVRTSRYRLSWTVADDLDGALTSAGNGLQVIGHGANHQADTPGEFAFVPPFRCRSACSWRLHRSFERPRQVAVTGRPTEVRACRFAGDARLEESVLVYGENSDEHRAA
jgi:hypothetical protein